jgi:hypothetical protein
MGGGDEKSTQKQREATEAAEDARADSLLDGSSTVDAIAKKLKDYIRKHRHLGSPPKEKVTTFPRISSPISALKAKYDVVVVGSGYGASISASRLSRAGKSVCVLELGKEKVPGEYAKDVEEVCFVCWPGIRFVVYMFILYLITRFFQK